MQRPAPGFAGMPVHTRGEQRMGETHTVSFDLDDPRSRSDIEVFEE
jgi:hypothetical protein